MLREKAYKTVRRASCRDIEGTLVIHLYEFVTIPESIISYARDRAPYRHRGQSRATVEGMISYALDRVGYNDRYKSGIPVERILIYLVCTHGSSVVCHETLRQGYIRSFAVVAYEIAFRSVV